MSWSDSDEDIVLKALILNKWITDYSYDRQNLYLNFTEIGKFKMTDYKSHISELGLNAAHHGEIMLFFSQLANLKNKKN